MDWRKKLRLTRVLAMAFVAVLGCGVDVETTTNSTLSSIEQTTTLPQTETTTEPSPLISAGPDYAITDLAIDFVFSDRVMKTYHSSADPKTAYVNIEECMALFGKDIIVIPKREEAKLELHLHETLPETLKDEYGTPVFQFIMSFDATRDTVAINDMRMFDYLLPGNEDPYYTLLRLKGTEITPVDRSISIDLIKYEIDVVFEQGAFYIPLYLANLLLTGPSLEWFEMGEKIIAYDSHIELSSLRNTYRADHLMDLAIVGKNTEKFLCVFFDHFYGLKASRSVSSYRNMIKSYQLSEQPDFESFYRTLERLLDDQNDLHTRLVSAGYHGMDFIAREDYPEASRQALFEAAYKVNACGERTEEFVVHKREDVQIVEINAFSLETKNYLSQASLRNYLPIIIDVSCNTGGSLVAVIELLTYLTNDSIQIRSINPYTGERRVDTYKAATSRAIATPFYVLTSPVTFSAANLFVSIVQDMNLATVIGEPSMGGACAIQLTTLPDGSTIVSSSQFALVDAADRLIEDGVEVDAQRQMPIEMLTDTSRPFSLYTILTDSTLSIYQSESNLVIAHDPTYHSPSLTGLTYRLTIREGLTIVHTQSYSSALTMEWLMERHDVEYTVYLSVEYMNRNTFFHEALYHGSFDDYGDYRSADLVELTLNQPLEGGRSSLTDTDAFWIVISEPGTYQIRFGDGTSPDVTLYDYRRIVIQTGSTFDLVPGRYVVSIRYPANGVYQIHLLRPVRPSTAYPAYIPNALSIWLSVSDKSKASRN
jgi:hypothetical protein